MTSPHYTPPLIISLTSHNISTMAKTSATKKATAKKATGTKAKPARKSTEKEAAAPTGPLVSIEACKQ